MDGHPRRVLFAAAAGTFLVAAAYTVPLGALDSTARGLAANAAERAWIASSMSVGLACTLLPAGAAADAYGRRRVFVVGALVLALGAAGCALATTTLLFAIARVVAGAGGAALTASSLGILGHTFTEPASRARATGIWGAMLGAGIAAGPIGAGAFDLVTDFRAAHWALAAFGALVAVVSRPLLSESRAAKARAIDIKGAALLVIALSTLLTGLVELRSGGATALTASCLMAGVVFFVLFVVSQARGHEPMIDLALFRRPDFAAMMLASIFTGLGILAIMSFVPSALAVGQHRSVFEASLITSAWPALSVPTALAARRLPERISPRARFVGSFVLLAIAQASLARFDASTSVPSLALSLAFAGVASGMMNATLARQAVASVPAADAAMGSGAGNAARYIGAALGLTFVSLVMHHGGLASFDLAAAMTAGFSLLGALIVQWAARARSR